MKKPELDSELMARLFPATLGAKKAAREKAEQKAEEIMRRAVKDPVLLDEIQERACIRWAEGYSDSLLMAVLSGIALTGETIKRDADGQIILKPKTDWNAEISNL